MWNGEWKTEKDFEGNVDPSSPSIALFQISLDSMTRQRKVC